MTRLVQCWAIFGLLGSTSAFHGHSVRRKWLVTRQASRGSARPGTPSMMGGADLATLQQIQDVAVHACRVGGKLIKEKAGARVKDTKFNAKDLVTEVDGAVQVILEEHAKKAFPDHSFLGEESVDPGAAASAVALNKALKEQDGFMWVVDPIDGTTNFAHGCPLSAISIGVAYRGRLEVAVIYDPFADEMFTAIRGQGSRLNGEAIQVGEQGTLLESLVAAGCPPTLASLGPSLRGINAMAAQVRSLRLIGSAAIMLSWVACGRLTAYWEPDLNSWDTAAGALLVEEAGGRMTCAKTGKAYDLTVRSIVGSNGKIHDQLRNLLVTAKAVELDAIEG